MSSAFVSFVSTLERLSFADLASVQTVGIGLYLALGVIQVLSESGVNSLQRRLKTLREAVYGVV